MFLKTARLSSLPYLLSIGLDNIFFPNCDFFYLLANNVVRFLNRTKLQPDKHQFLSILEENKKIIFKVCNSYCANPEDRKDLTQEVIIQLWKSFDKYNPQYKLSTWIYRIALNVSISFYRSEHKIRKITSPMHDRVIEISDDGEAGEAESNINLLRQFIDQLDELNRALMILYLDDNSYKEIAEIIGITETNVATKISRIKKGLKQQFSNVK